MQIRKARHVDASEPDHRGMHEYRYEFDLYEFSEGGISYVARSYVDEPLDAHFLFKERKGKREPLSDADLVEPLFLESVEHLGREGRKVIRYLGQRGYEYFRTADDIE